ncbi:MAG: response regulator [Verrucomicrobia bacterium]|nr:response regulator [Verrucomicrobiota bacterium]
MKQKVILIENEPSWMQRLTAALAEAGFDEVVTFESYTRAERELSKLKTDEYALALIDVRMRRPVFDQGGLALLDLLKGKAPDLPIIMLTAYAQDYPGLQKTASRYARVFAYDKEVFLQSQSAILQALLQQLPPQVGEVSSNAHGIRQAGAASPTHERLSRKFSPLVIGLFCILLILGSGFATFALLEKFSQFSRYGNVIFALVTVCLMAVLIGSFGKETIQLAVRHSSSWLKSVFRGKGNSK